MRAITEGFPPSRMSVPRPAMLVATVTTPRRPACPTISLSRSTRSGLAFSVYRVGEGGGNAMGMVREWNLG